MGRKCRHWQIQPCQAVNNVWSALTERRVRCCDWGGALDILANINIEEADWPQLPGDIWIAFRYWDMLGLWWKPRPIQNKICSLNSHYIEFLYAFLWPDFYVADFCMCSTIAIKSINIILTSMPIKHCVPGMSEEVGTQARPGFLSAQTCAADNKVSVTTEGEGEHRTGWLELFTTLSTAVQM